MSGASRFIGVAVILAVIAVLAVLLTPPAPSLTGRASAVDGDTLRMGSVRIRLLGIDAPELDQTCADAGGLSWACGLKAKAFTSTLVGAASLTCLSSGRDRYGRTLARCSAGDTDIGRAIIAAGWAVAERDYALAETEARAARSGIWAGNFELPADWRRNHGAAEPGLWDWIRSWFE